MSLRRRTSQHCISLPAHQTIDLCKQLGKTPAEVHAILAVSPQVQRFAKRALVIWYDVMPEIPKSEQLRFVSDPRDDGGTDLLGELLSGDDD